MRLLSILDQQELVGVQDGSFELFCPQMELQRPSARGLRKYTGHGVVRYDSQHRLQFELNAVESRTGIDALDDLQELTSVPLGDVIPDSHYFSLMAIDAKGRTWRSSEISPDIKPDRATGGTRVSGSLDEAAYELTAADEDNTSFFYVIALGKLKAPTNVSISDLDDSEKPIKSNKRGLKINHQLYSVLILSSPESFSVRITNTWDILPLHFDKRVIETLQFILARPLLFILMFQQDSQTSKLTLYSKRQRQAEARLSPPIRLDEVDAIDDIGNLFCRYLDFILQHEHKTFHSVSGQVNSILYASAGFFETEAIALSVAIESILKDNLPNIGLPSEQLKKELNEAVEYIKSWRGSPEVRKRIEGSIKAMLTPRALDKLAALEIKRVITTEQRAEWSYIRNRMAHSGRLDSISAEELIPRINRLLILFYRIIFYIIGYQGKYTDYSSRGWPTSNFIVETTSD